MPFLPTILRCISVAYSFSTSLPQHSAFCLFQSSTVCLLLSAKVTTDKPKGHRATELIKRSLFRFAPNTFKEVKPEMLRDLDPARSRARDSVNYSKLQFRETLDRSGIGCVSPVKNPAGTGFSAGPIGDPARSCMVFPDFCYALALNVY